MAVIQSIVGWIFGVSPGSSFGSVIFPAWVLARVAYHAPLEGYFGWTPGKLAMRLRVRSDTGDSPGVEAAFVRNAFRAVDGISYYTVGGMVALFGANGERIGDRVAGTYVEALPLPLIAPAAGTIPGAGGGSLKNYTTDLTANAKRGKIAPVVGREEEVRQVVQTLGRNKKNNPVLVGEAGVGKTAVAEGLARIAAGLDGEVPEELRGKRILELDLTAINSGASYVGMFEERMEAVIKGASRPNVILFVDEMHRLMSFGSSRNEAAPGAQMLKPALARGDITMMGATTLDEWREVEKDPAMERRFQPVTVPPLPVEATTEVLRSARAGWERSGVEIGEDALEVAAGWADKYLKGNLPDTALTLMDDAASRKRMDGGGVVSKDDLAGAIERQTGIKVGSSATERERLGNLEGELKRRVIGQDGAARIVAMTMMRRATIGEDKPASLLFLGPTGVGKTEMAKALAEALFGDERRMVRIDMSEMSQEGSEWRLVGSPRGYQGSEAGGQLTEGVRREPYSVVLLDEIEKANPRILTLLLQLLDEGRLTDGTGREVDFRHAIVVMTSNVGAERILAGETDPASAVEELRRRGFPPELVGRMHEIVVFGQLPREALERIVVLLARKPLARVGENHGIEIELDRSLVAQIAGEGENPQFGARGLANLVRRYVEDFVTERIMDGDFGGGSGHRRVVLWYDAESGSVEWEPAAGARRTGRVEEEV